jgi:hypothetical protein
VIKLRQLSLLVFPVLALACSKSTQPPGTAVAPTSDCCGKAVLDRGLDIAQRYKVVALTTRRFSHERLWTALRPSLRDSSLRVTQLGQSIQGRDIRAISFGQGPVKVLLWSQMHGDEATATMALADIFRFLVEAPADELRQRLDRELTIVFVPMLNPDGAELFQRENAAGIDVNRDARQLASPEARILKGLRDSLLPDFGFNLHDQNARTLAGLGGPQVAIALLDPAYDAARSYNPVRTRARQVAAVMAGILGHEIPGRVARYDDEFTPRAFGDLIQQWGTSTVLIESGVFPGDPEKQKLRALNVAAILGALDAIATGSFRSVDTELYTRLPENTPGSDLIIRGGQLVLPTGPIRADVAINYDEPGARTGARIREIGDLRDLAAIDTVDASGLFVHPGAFTTRDGASWLRPGAQVGFTIRRGQSPNSELVRRIN